MRKSLTIKSFLLLAFLIFFINNNTSVVFAQLPEIQSVDFEQLNLLNMQNPIMYSHYGLLTVSYVPASMGYYLTVGITRTDNSTFSLVVENMYLPSAAFIATLQYLSMRIDLTELGVSDGTQIPPSVLLRVYIHMASSPIMNPNSGNFYGEFNPPVAYGDDDSEGIDSPVPVEEAQITQESPPDDYTPVTDVNYRGCRVPNVDLNDGQYPDNDTYAGDKNACGPASATNSMAWLADVYSSSIHLDESLRDILTELSAYMQRARNSGVTIQQFVKGKLDFIKAKNLPINVKFQSADVTGNILSSDSSSFARNDNGSAPYPTWNWVKAEMDSGEDVEALYYWFNGEMWRGHAICLTGYDVTQGGKVTLKYKHDRKQGAEGGTQQEAANIFIDTYGRIVFYKNGVRKYVRHVVAESPGDPYTPVELSSFNAELISGVVTLKWKTITETNNKGFEIEKSTNGYTFRNIGFIYGNGTTTEPQIYSFTDKNIVENIKYFYRLKQLDYDGSYQYSQVVEVKNTIPVEFHLSQNYPNPFNPVTYIGYELPVASHVVLTVFDINGKEIEVLVDQNKPAGKYKVKFDATKIPSGVYFYKLQAGDYFETKKMTIIK